MPTKALIAVIGAGLMGHGIAQVFAKAGHAVSVYDNSDYVLKELRERVAKGLEQTLGDGSAARLVTPCYNIGTAVRSADVVFEAGPENLSFKRAIFKDIGEMAPAHALLASNTSVIPITQIMEDVKFRERTLGTHWWNPPYLVPLVEVVKTEHTTSQSITSMIELLSSVGKTPVTVNSDVPGFIGNRLQHAMWREAISLVARGVCDAETIDIVVKSSFGMRLAVLGPLENADLVGTDLTLAVHDCVLRDLDSSTEASPYLRELVAQGRLGMKSGEGFRTWSEEQKSAVRSKLVEHLKRLSAAMG